MAAKISNIFPSLDDFIAVIQQIKLVIKEQFPIVIVEITRNSSKDLSKQLNNLVLSYAALFEHSATIIILRSKLQECSLDAKLPFIEHVDVLINEIQSFQTASETMVSDSSRFQEIGKLLSPFYETNIKLLEQLRALRKRSGGDDDSERIDIPAILDDVIGHEEHDIDSDSESSDLPVISGGDEGCPLVGGWESATRLKLFRQRYTELVKNRKNTEDWYRKVFLPQVASILSQKKEKVDEGRVLELIRTRCEALISDIEGVLDKVHFISVAFRKLIERIDAMGLVPKFLDYLRRQLELYGVKHPIPETSEITDLVYLWDEIDSAILEAAAKHGKGFPLPASAETAKFRAGTQFLRGNYRHESKELLKEVHHQLGFLNQVYTEPFNFSFDTRDDLKTKIDAMLHNLDQILQIEETWVARKELSMAKMAQALAKVVDILVKVLDGQNKDLCICNGVRWMLEGGDLKGRRARLEKLR